jgi:TonB family protein
MVYMTSGLRRILPCLLLSALVAWSAPVGAQEAPRVAGTDVPAPKRTKTVLPEYPPEAQAQGIRGIVIIDLVIDTEGRVASASILRSIPGLDEAALAAVRQWEFEVTKVDGKPVSVRLNVPITFTIKPPDISRDKGVPSLQQGVPPAYPGDLTDKSATVTAQVALDGSGSVVDALVISGASPWTEALLRALRTWKFTMDPPGRTVAFKLEAKFVGAGKGGSPRVELKASDAREGAVEPAATAPPPPPNAAPAATAEAAPTAPPAEQKTPAASAPAQEAAAAPPPSAEAAPAPEAPPPVEMIPAPPTTAPPEPARPPENGVSSIADVTLREGIPDLVKGRHPVPPPLARINGVKGSVRVRFAVNAAGIPSVEDVDGPDLLKPAARSTVSSWTFRRTSVRRLHLVASFDYGDDTATATVVNEESPAPAAAPSPEPAAEAPPPAAP